MSDAALDKLVWVLIYSGLLLVCVGVFLVRGDAPGGRLVVGAGALDAAIGTLLIWVRSRRKG